MRQSYQIIVIPFLRTPDIKYCVFRRRKSYYRGKYYQFVSGGSEVGETVEQTAVRELFEETGIVGDGLLIHLDSVCSVPVEVFKDVNFDRKENLYVVKEYCFAIEVFNEKIVLSEEHDRYEFCAYEDAKEKLLYDSNITALYELNQKLLDGLL